MIRKGPSAPSHEHEWPPLRESDVVFEDGAAIIHQRCEWVEITSTHHSEKHDEVFHGEGAECDETRTIRFEPVEATKLMEGEPDITIDRRAFDTFKEKIESVLVSIERSMDSGDGEIVGMEPDVESGYIKAQNDDYRVKYCNESQLA